jgi:DNA-binding transcriptional regulator YiaG
MYNKQRGNKMTDAELIRISRELLKQNQRQFAKVIDYSLAVVASWETGRRKPRPQVFRQILAAIVESQLQIAKRYEAINEIAAKINTKDN